VRSSDHVATPNPAWDSDNPDPATSSAPYRVYNIGNNEPTELRDLISALEDALGIKAERTLLPMQQGDVSATYADVEDLVQDCGFRPGTPVETGVRRFVEWYREFYGSEGRR